MNIGEKYYCKYIRDGQIVVSTAEVKEISEDRSRAVLSNGRKIDIVTGRQDTSKIFWHPWDDKDEELQTYHLAGKARKWFKKMLSVNEIAVNMYKKMVKKFPVDTRAYYHRLSPDAIELMDGVDTGFLKDNYRQPDWCCNPNALNGPLGCRHLLLGKIKKESNCIFCRYCIPLHMDNYRRLRLISGLSVQVCNAMLGISDYDRLESGERPPTQRELNIMATMFNINDWSLQETLTYFSNVDVRQLQKRINHDINIKQLFDEKKKIRF